jgi:mono/diheme cytochrome c family protein
MFARTILALVALLACAVALRAQDTPRIWQGVYTTAQAERGKAVFSTACIRCHGADLAGTTAPALKGDRFQSSWGGGMIESLFGKIRDTMPPNFGTILDDKAKLDIVSYILQTNGFPAGTAELLVGGADLASAQILRKGEQASVQNFSLVQAVGCLAAGPSNTWMLTRTADPVTTRDDAPNERGLAEAAARSLGTKTYRLLSAVPFSPQSHAGQKVEARGLIYNEPGDERITLTSLQGTGTECRE